MNSIRSGLIIILMQLCLYGLAFADKWDDADAATIRAKPDQFTNMPDKIVNHLIKIGCTIPQSYGSNRLHNIIWGEFAKKGQKDWAVLCSRDKTSSVLIFWGGEVTCPSEIRMSKDRIWLTNTGERIEYARMLNPAGIDNKEILVKDRKEEKSIVAEHMGIEEISLEKGSTIYFCHNGEWVEFIGTD